MPISVDVRGESGEVIRSGEQPFRMDVEILDYGEFPLLWAIDPYGDTVFNHLQVGMLQKEVRRLAERPIALEERGSLDEIASLCEEVLKRPHRYLWFQGD